MDNVRIRPGAERITAVDAAVALADHTALGRMEQLTDEDRRGLAAVHGYDLGPGDALRMTEP